MLLLRQRTSNRWDLYGKEKTIKKKKKRLSKLLLFIVIIILSYILVFKTDIFIVVGIIVEGNNKLSYEEVVKASTCNIGENIFKIDIKKGEESLNQIPYVKKSKIKRKLPDKIIIEIEERKEVAAIQYLNLVAYIDIEGYILNIEENTGNILLPEIKGLDLESVEEGSSIYQEVSMEDMEEFILYSENLDILELMKEVDVSNKDNIIIYLKDGKLVAFGPLNNVKYKLSFLNGILDDIEKKGLEVKKILFDKGENPVIVTDNR